MAGVPVMSLKAAQFTPATFTPNEYKYQGEDLSILERSLANREARMEKAYQQYANVDVALGNIEQKLNKAESTWFNDYKNNIKRQIKDNIDVGNFGQAIRTSLQLAGDTAQDTAILSRIQANDEFNKYVDTLKQRAAKGEISGDTLAYALATNTYGFTEMLDSNGNVVGGKLNDMRTIYNTIKWDELAAKAASFNRPDVEQSTRGEGGHNPAEYKAGKDGVVSADGMLGQASDSHQWSNMLEEITSEEILDTIGKILNIPDLSAQAIQDFDVNMWKYNNMMLNGFNESDYEALKQAGFIKNGSIISREEYLNDKKRLFINALAYRKHSSSDIREEGFTLTGTGKKNGEGDGDNEGLPADTQITAPGTNVQMTGTDAMANGASSSANNANKGIIEGSNDIKQPAQKNKVTPPEIFTPKVTIN